jgi:hypothetical protein
VRYWTQGKEVTHGTFTDLKVAELAEAIASAFRPLSVGIHRGQAGIMIEAAAQLHRGEKIVLRDVLRHTTRKRLMRADRRASAGAATERIRRKPRKAKPVSRAAMYSEMSNFDQVLDFAFLQNIMDD